MSPHRIKEIPRKHVLNTLAEAVKSHSLVILKSPMVYGKTAAARELGEHLKREGYLICFETTPSNADDLRTLFCNPYQESGFAGSVRCKEDGESDACRNMSDFLATFRENLGGRPVLFILDDYQSAQSPEVNGLIEIMARESIPGFCILLLSRDRPILPIEDLLLSNNTAMFTPELLSLSELVTETLCAGNGTDYQESVAAFWEPSER